LAQHFFALIACFHPRTTGKHNDVAGISDEDLQAAIRHAITLKPERHEFNEKPSQVVRFMSATGG